MDKLIRARQKLAATVEKIESLVTKAVDEDRGLSEDEKEQVAKLEQERDGQKSLVSQLEQLKKDQAELSERADSEIPVQAVKVVREEGEDENGNYRPFRSFGEQLQLVQRAALSPHNVDSRLVQLNKRAASGLSEGVGADGGFLVQTDIAAGLQKAAFDTGVLASRVRQIPISSGANGLIMNTVDETSRVKGSRWGGVQVYWENEADAATAAKPKFGQLEFRLQKLLGLCYATDELLADSSALGSVISQAFTEEFAFELDEAILRGDGAGKPLGILNAACTVSITGESASLIKSNDIINARARLWSRSRANSVWLINQDVEPSLQKMFVAGASSDLHVYTPANGLSGMPYDTLYGRPVIPIEQASSVGTVGDVVLADLSQYGFIQRGGVEAATSIHVRFLNDETAFRFVMRVDGKPLWKSAVTPARGSNTQSPFVTVATR